MLLITITVTNEQQISCNITQVNFGTDFTLSLLTFMNGKRKHDTCDMNVSVKLIRV